MEKIFKNRSQETKKIIFCKFTITLPFERKPFKPGARKTRCATQSTFHIFILNVGLNFRFLAHLQISEVLFEYMLSMAWAMLNLMPGFRALSHTSISSDNPNYSLSSHQTQQIMDWQCNEAPFV